MKGEGPEEGGDWRSGQVQRERFKDLAEMEAFTTALLSDLTHVASIHRREMKDWTPIRFWRHMKQDTNFFTFVLSFVVVMLFAAVWWPWGAVLGAVLCHLILWSVYLAVTRFMHQGSMDGYVRQFDVDAGQLVDRIGKEMIVKDMEFNYLKTDHTIFRKNEPALIRAWKDGLTLNVLVWRSISIKCTDVLTTVHVGEYHVWKRERILAMMDLVDRSALAIRKSNR